MAAAWIYEGENWNSPRLKFRVGTEAFCKVPWTVSTPK